MSIETEANDDVVGEGPARAYRRGRSPFRPSPREPLRARLSPVTAHLTAYGSSTGRRDLLAGLTVAALALPSAMAYAEVAGLSPVNGLYALLLPTVLYTFLGSPRQLIVGPEGSISTLVGAAILPLAVAGSAQAAGACGDTRPACWRVLSPGLGRAPLAGWLTTSHVPFLSGTSTASP